MASLDWQAHWTPEGFRAIIQKALRRGSWPVIRRSSALAASGSYLQIWAGRTSAPREKTLSDSVAIMGITAGMAHVYAHEETERIQREAFSRVTIGSLLALANLA